ncbi:MAG: hypothetical protein IJ629_02155 [Clostridia bacterium]|nr:hypothetical protein [Clostridia bacterium]
MKEDEQILFYWNLRKFQPRVDLEIHGEAQSLNFRELFPFKVRSTDKTCAHRHYKLPVWFHIPPVRWYYQHKLNNAK